VPGKYDPLGRHLSDRDKGERRLTMPFADIDRLVGQLPASARSRPGWWTDDAEARVQVRAWRGAGWRVESLDLANETVTFARRADDGAVAAPGQRAAAGDDGPGPGSGAARKSWRSIAGDLRAGAISSVTAGVTAIIAAGHIPWPAVALLTIGVTAVAFGATQAVISWGSAETARKWLAATVAVVLLTAGGVAVYHEQFDPSTRPAGQPFTATVSTDPSSLVSPQECRTVVFPGPWRDPAPPPTLTQEAVNGWEQSEHGVDGIQTLVAIVLQGRSDQDVVISSPRVVMASRTGPLRGPAAELGGCGGEVKPRLFTVNLDQQNPSAVFRNGTPFPALASVAGVIRQARSAVFTISASDPEYFVVQATTTRHFVRWYLEVSWQSEGKSGTLRIGNGEQPFATSSVSQLVNRMYYLRPDGKMISLPQARK